MEISVFESPMGTRMSGLHTSLSKRGSCKRGSAGIRNSLNLPNFFDPFAELWDFIGFSTMIRRDIFRGAGGFMRCRARERVKRNRGPSDK